MPDNKKKLYDALVQKGLDLGDYGLYVQKIQNPENRKKLYGAALEAGLDVGDFPVFENSLAAPPFVTAPTDRTSVNKFPAPPQSRGLGDIAGSIGRTMSFMGNPSRFGEYAGRDPRNAARDIGTTAEMTLPLLSLLPGGQAIGLPARMAVEGALQGTGTLLRESMESSVAPPGQQTLLGEQFGRAGMSAGLGAAATGAGGLVARGLQKTAAPFAGRFDPQAAAVAKKYGVDMPASALSGSEAVPILESLVKKGVFGSKIQERIQAAGVKINQIGDNLVSSFGKSTSPVEVGNAVGDGLKKFETVFRETKNALYEAAKVNKGEIIVNPKETLPLLNELIDNLGGMAGKKPAILGELKQLRSALDPNFAMREEFAAKGFKENTIEQIMKQNQQATAVDGRAVLAKLRDLSTKVNFKNPNPIIQGYEAELRKVAATLSDDLDNAIATQRPDLADALDKARKYYGENVEKLNSAWGKKINQFVKAGKASAIAPSILNRTTPVEWVPKIFETVGEDAAQSLQATTMERLIQSARGNAGFLTEGGLNKQIRQYGEDKLLAIFGPDKLEKLKDVAKLSESLGRSQGVASGSQTAFIGRIIAEISSLGNPARLAKMIGGDWLYSKFISGARGQQWLGPGFRLPTATTPALSTGLRAATLPNPQ